MAQNRFAYPARFAVDEAGPRPDRLVGVSPIAEWAYIEACPGERESPRTRLGGKT